MTTRIQAELDQALGRLNELERIVANIPLEEGGGGSGGAGDRVPTVLVLPAIPTGVAKAKKVFWTSDGEGTGDDQMWEVYVGQDAWTPVQFTTSNSGAVV